MMLLAVMTMALTRLPPKTTRRCFCVFFGGAKLVVRCFAWQKFEEIRDAGGDMGIPVSCRFLVLMKWPDEAFIFWCSCLLAKRV